MVEKPNTYLNDKGNTMSVTTEITNQNSIVGEVMAVDTKRVVVFPSNGLPIMNNDDMDISKDVENTDTVSVTKTQSEINKVAFDSMFDGKGYSKGNPNSGEKEYEVEVSDKSYDGIKDKIVEILPIEKVNQTFDFELLQKSEKDLRESLLDDLKKAQFYTMVSLYYYVKVGKTLISIQNKRQNKSLKKIIQSVGLNERTAFRYMKLANDVRFSNMTENQFKCLHHLTQSKMLMMTKFDNSKFEKALNDEDYVFPSKPTKPKIKPNDLMISKEKYDELLKYDKHILITYYDALYKELMEYKNKFYELNMKGDE